MQIRDARDWQRRESPQRFQQRRPSTLSALFRLSRQFAALLSRKGRFYNDQDNEEGRQRRLPRQRHQEATVRRTRSSLGQTIQLNGIPYTVIGVMKTKDQNSSYDGLDIRKIFIPFNSMRRDFPNKPPAVEHSVDRLLVAPWSLETHPDCVHQLRRSLGRLHDFDPRDEDAASIWDTVKNAQANRMIFVGMEVFMGAVGIATIFLGGLGVMNVMLVSVRERTREIGVRKALGATRESILRQFFLETVILVGISGSVGLLISYSICGLFNLLPKMPFFDGLTPSWQLAALTIGLLAIIAVLSALYPANRAASVDPIEALRFEAGG